MVVALAGLSFVVEADTSVWTLVPFMVLLGLGLGFNMQPIILAVQNAVSPREIGVATSSVTFFRQMGGTIGTAAFLSIMFTRLGTEIPEQIRQAAQASPEAAQQAMALQQAGADSVLADTSAIDAFPALVMPFRVGFSNTLDLVFLVAAGVVAVGFFVLWFLPQLELRNQSGIQAQQNEASGTGSEPDDAAGQASEAAGHAAPTSVAPAAAPSSGDDTRGGVGSPRG
jgi:hypothetical protein